MPLHRLIILRHGKAEQKAGSNLDFDRALVERGRLEAAETARRLAAAGLVPELALVSAARRTLETWRAAAPAFPAARLQEVRALYHADPTAMLELAEDAGAASVMIVGHNPGVHALAFELAARGGAATAEARALARGFPTAAAAAFRFERGATVCEAVIFPGEGDAR